MVNYESEMLKHLIVKVKSDENNIKVMTDTGLLEGLDIASRSLLSKHMVTVVLMCEDNEKLSGLFTFMLPCLRRTWTTILTHSEKDNFNILNFNVRRFVRLFEEDFDEILDFFRDKFHNCDYEAMATADISENIAMDFINLEKVRMKDPQEYKRLIRADKIENIIKE